MLDALYPPFPGYRKEGLELLRQLREHNERPWFQARKEAFETELFWPTRCLVAELSMSFARMGIPLRADPEQALFRIYRDVRFSRDKRPYKTHIGAILSRSGRRMEQGVLYIHIEPGNALLGAGFWRPDREMLLRFRQAIVRDPETFLDMVETLAGHGLTVTARDTLKRLPRGFAVDPAHPVAPYLRYISFVTQRPLEDQALLSRDLLPIIYTFTREMLPLLEWGWEAMEHPL